MDHFFVDRDISRARTISTDVYNSEEIFELIKERIFSSTWQLGSDDSGLKNANDCKPFNLLKDMLDEPLVLVNNAGNIQCYSNVCTHRGNILVDHECNVSTLKCRYHGRVFNLDGRFRSMPEFREVKDFPSDEDNLTRIPLFRWEQFLFTNLKGNIDPSVFFRDMIARVAWLPVKEFIYSPELSKTYEINANWALYCENYLEGFHIPFVHEGLNAELDFSNYHTEIFYPYSSLQLGISKTGENCFDLPVDSEDYGKNISAYYFWVFPNMMFNFYPWGLSINIIEPRSVRSTRVKFLTYVWKPEKLSSGAGADLHKVEMEDEEIVENVQKGVRSRFYKHGRYSVSKERGTHHFHTLLSEFLSAKEAGGN